MKYELYIDVFIMSNFCMDALALILTGVFLRKRQKVGRLVLAAFVGTVATVALFLFLTNYILYVILVHFLVNTCMVWLAFVPKSGREFFSEWLVCYLVVWLTGGIMQWLSVTVFEGEHSGLCIALTFALGMVAAIVWEKQTAVGKRVYEVKLLIGSDTLELKAYYDTGNLLTDPYFREPVQIAAGEKIQKYLDRNQVSGRLIVFSSLGEKNGWIKAYTVDELLIYQKKDVVRVKPAVVGIAENQLFEQEDYQMILNGHLRLKG